ncbi:MAG: serine hydrolase [Candidatus Neomarinimicrobiota bacterium]|jgi:CubicO group peptidase (beta-lactamase class C family)|nr:serine hydrolase [Candidatus Neomarinimicrobiota bacterium]
MFKKLSGYLLFITIGATLLMSSCEKPGLKYKALEGMMQDAVADSAWPGCVLLVGRGDSIVFWEAAGYTSYAQIQKIRKDDIFDLASVSKVIGSTSALMMLTESGQIGLEDRAVKYLPQLRGPDALTTIQKKQISIRHLLTHTAGFEPFRLFYQMDIPQEARWDSVYQSPLLTKPGTATVYSDIGLMLLGKIIEAVTGLPLDSYLQKAIFEPLKMEDTFYNPPAGLRERIVPTEIDPERGGLVHGIVHDENTESLGGVAGHAGLFSTAGDLSRFCRMMLNMGELEGIRIFEPETVRQFTARISAESSRCLGWDSPEGESSGGIYLSSESYGHTGFTGTSLWIDPVNGVYVILLSNAVHPDRSWKMPKYYEWRQLLHSAAYEELGIRKRNPDLVLKARWAKEFGIKSRVSGSGNRSKHN